MKWKHIKRMGMLMGHGVARYMPDELPTDHRGYVDITDTLQCALGAQGEENIKNRESGMPKLCQQPMSYIGEKGLEYRLGSWIVAEQCGSEDVWQLRVEGSDGDIIAHYGLDSDDPCYNPPYDMYNQIVMDEDEDECDALWIISWLSEALPVDSYSGRAYRRLLADWPFDSCYVDRGYGPIGPCCDQGMWFPNESGELELDPDEWPCEKPEPPYPWMRVEVCEEFFLALKER